MQLDVTMLQGVFGIRGRGLFLSVSDRNHHDAVEKILLRVVP